MFSITYTDNVQSRGLATPAKQSGQKTFDLYKFLIITIINPKLLFRSFPSPT